MTSPQREKHFRFKEKVLGQFFTPPVIADFIVSFALASVENAKKGCDPACGDGVFLSSMIKHGLTEIIGVDIDEEVVKNIPLGVKEKAKIIVGDALQRNPSIIPEDYFDIVVGNPPFSAKYGRVTNRDILAGYKLALNTKSQAIEVLFLERFIQLARKGGVIGIILPDGVLLNVNYRKVREYILENTRVLAVISLPRGVFNSSKSTTSKTSILFLMKGVKHEGKVFMAHVEDVSELPRLLNLYRERKSGVNATWTDITADSLHPKSYLVQQVVEFRAPALKLGEIVDEILTGSTEYGSNRKFSSRGIRFISAKVVTPLGLDFTRDEKYVEPGSLMDKKKAHVRVGDVLFVRVGVGCIGRAAVVVDEKDLGVADDWIYIIRVKKEYSPYYLAIFLQSRCGKMQIDKAKRGVGTETIPQKLLKEILVPVPEPEFQETIEKEYKRMVELRRKGDYGLARKIFEDLVAMVESKVCSS